MMTEEDVRRQTMRLHLILDTEAGKEAIKRLGYIHESVLQVPSYTEQKAARGDIPPTYVDNPREHEETNG